jgi:hypothetical protein
VASDAEAAVADPAVPAPRREQVKDAAVPAAYVTVVIPVTIRARELLATEFPDPPRTQRKDDSRRGERGLAHAVRQARREGSGSAWGRSGAVVELPSFQGGEYGTSKMPSGLEWLDSAELVEIEDHTTELPCTAVLLLRGELRLRPGPRSGLAKVNDELGVLVRSVQRASNTTKNQPRWLLKSVEPCNGSTALVLWSLPPDGPATLMPQDPDHRLRRLRDLSGSGDVDTEWDAPGTFAALGATTVGRRAIVQTRSKPAGRPDDFAGSNALAVAVLLDSALQRFADDFGRRAPSMVDAAADLEPYRQLRARYYAVRSAYLWPQSSFHVAEQQYIDCLTKVLGTDRLAETIDREINDYAALESDRAGRALADAAQRVAGISLIFAVAGVLVTGVPAVLQAFGWDSWIVAGPLLLVMAGSMAWMASLWLRKRPETRRRS